MRKIITYSTTINSDASVEVGIHNLAAYLYKEGAIKVETKWDPELQTNRTVYKIDVVINKEE